MKASITTLISFPIAHRPGELANIATQLSEKGINLSGISTSVEEDMATMNIVTNTPDSLELINSLGIDAISKEILSVKVPAQVGAMATMAQKLGDVGINMVSIFASESPGNEDTILFVEVSDNQAALEALV
jgi:hypothetical protein